MISAIDMLNTDKKQKHRKTLEAVILKY